MNECDCYADPDPNAVDILSENPSSPKDQCFNVEIKYTESHVLNARRFETFEDTQYYSFKNVPKDDLMQETTILRWLSDMNVPSDFHKVIVAKILTCARDMITRTHKEYRVLNIRVGIMININDNDDDDSNNDNDDDEDEEVRFVPASNLSIEGLETINEEGGVNGVRCSICCEDIEVVSVQMPCLHKFHRTCIVDWLKVSGLCPLCRSQL